MRTLLLSLVALGLTLTPAGADTSPLRLVPAELDAVVQIPDPPRLVAALRNLDALRQLTSLAAIKEQLDSTNARRGRQLLAYFEKTLGVPWHEAVDKLAGHGAVVGLKVGEGNPPLVLVVQGKDEKLLAKFVDAAVGVLEGELARQESKDQVKKGDYHGIPAYRLNDLYFARAGSALVVANKKEAMQRALDLHRGAEKRSLVGHAGLAEAATLLPAKPLITGWLNMRPVQQSREAKELYKSPRDNNILTVLFGGYLDLLGRTPFVCAGLAETETGFVLTARGPRGTEGMGPDRELHLPPDGKPGGKPLLEPKGVLYSTSFHLDVSRIWTDREKLFPKAQADALAAADKNSGGILAGVKLSRLLESVGPWHRVVVANHARPVYQREPTTRIPAFAFVPQLRDGDRFARTADTLIRAAGLFLTDQFKLELIEEKYKGFDVFGYRCDEKGVVKDDVENLRYNFMPCFVRVKDQFVFASTLDLAKELVDLLTAEESATAHGDRGRDRIYAKGLAELLKSQDDQLITQTILDQAVPPAEARKQVDELIRFVGGLGGVTTAFRVEPKRFRLDLNLHLKK